MVRQRTNPGPACPASGVGPSPLSKTGHTNATLALIWMGRFSRAADEGTFGMACQFNFPCEVLSDAQTLV